MYAKTTQSFISIEQFCIDLQLIQPDSKVIVGLSGGPDSIFLLHFLHTIKDTYNISLIAAHLNHEWRAEAHNDVQFCKDVCEKLSIPFVAQKISDLDLPLKFNGSKEEIGRKARRYFLEKVKIEQSANAIALGHHAQDQQETFFIRLLRGSSLTGLCSMKPKEGDYIRPLLHIHKSDIIAYLHTHNITYLIDPTNESDSYLRNRIRKKIIPYLSEVDHRFDQNFQTTIDRLQKTEQFLHILTLEAFNTIAKREKDMVSIDVLQILSLHSELRYRVLLYWLINQKVKFPPTQAFLDEIIRFLQSNENKKHQIHPQWSITKKGNRACII